MRMGEIHTPGYQGDDVNSIEQAVISTFAKQLTEGENAKVRHLYQWGEEGPTTECCPDCPACAIQKAANLPVGPIRKEAML